MRFCEFRISLSEKFRHAIYMSVSPLNYICSRSKKCLINLDDSEDPGTTGQLAQRPFNQRLEGDCHVIFVSGGANGIWALSLQFTLGSHTHIQPVMIVFIRSHGVDR
jgi:hypothetical protein